MGIHEASGGLKQYALILIVAMLIYILPIVVFFASPDFLLLLSSFHLSSHEHNCASFP